ncbi:transposase [Burkholderia gladioli]|uniref:Transposase IS3/IS911 family protein n=1 Tax=Burkholderia gladioli (strain BSR3) TaxID=999541 RepID=F2LTD4_BURGS|nr:transposase [Burkholderia gladioli]AEA66080.1 transposase IS3/IS911 family protein [Burkholderia gladioli BSR3]MBW5288231.1 transposase [Burkholderia gladioli]
MTDKDSELRVVRHNSDGRRRYNEKGKRALVEAALRPGVSVARLAQEHGINANLLRKRISKCLMEREKGLVPASQDNDVDERDLPPAVEAIDGVAIDLPGSLKRISATVPPPAFVPVVSAPPLTSLSPPSASMTLALHVRLSNGVELELGKAIATVDELTTLVQILGRMPCSGSTKA